MGVSSGGRVDRSRDSEPMSGFFAVCCQCCNHQVLSHGAAGPWQVVTLLTGSNSRVLMVAGDDKMFVTRTLSVTLKITEQHLIVRSD